MSIYADKKVRTPEEIGKFEAESYFLARKFDQNLLANVIAQSIRAYESDIAAATCNKCIERVEVLPIGNDSNDAWSFKERAIAALKSVLGVEQP